MDGLQKEKTLINLHTHGYAMQRISLLSGMLKRYNSTYEFNYPKEFKRKTLKHFVCIKVYTRASEMQMKTLASSELKDITEHMNRLKQ